MAQEQGRRRATTDVAPVQLRAFLITDVRGYTRFTSEQGNEAATELAKQFAAVVRSAVSEHGGELLELRGDEAMCVFPLALQALRASIEVQRRLRTESDDGPPLPLGVGIGIDVGEAVPVNGGYRGAALNVASRLCSLARPGQVLASDTAVRLAGGLAGVRYDRRRPVKLKGLAEPVRMVEVVPETPLPPLPSPSGKRSTRRHRLILLAAAALVVGTAIAVALVYSGRGNPRPPQSAVQPVTEGIYRIDPQRRRLTAAIPLPVGRVSPTLSYAFGYVWANLETGEARIDPKTNAVKRFNTGGWSYVRCGSRLCAAGGTIGTNDVMFLDPSDPDQEIEAIRGQPFDPQERQAGFYVATGFGSIWVRESGAPGCCTGRVFWRIDFKTHRVVGRWRNPDAFAVSEREGVWVIYGERLFRIDPATNKLSRVDGVGRAWTLAVGNGAVWVGDFAATTIRELNPDTGAVIWRHRVPIHIQRIIAGGGNAWLEDVDGHALVRVSALSHAISPSLKTPFRPGTMAISPDALWVRFPQSSDPYLNGDARL